MNIAVTGATGFIGSHLVSQLSKVGHHVAGIYNSGTPNLENNTETVSFLKADLTQPKTLSSVFSDFDKFDAILHLASYVHRVPKSKFDVSTVFRINVDGTRNLLRSLKTPPSTFFFFSTVAVYGLEEGADIDESTTPAPVTPYGESKLEAEEIVREWGRREGVSTIIYRLPLVYGAGNKGNMERLVKWINRGFCITVGDGSNLRSLVHVENIVDVTKNILNRTDTVSGVYHITDEHNYTYRDLCRSIGNALDKKVKMVSIPSSIADCAAKVGDICHLPLISSKTLKKISGTLTFDSTRIQKALQLKPRFGIQDFLRSEYV